MKKSDIISQADVYKTAKEIGVPMRTKGKNIQIICPGHEKHMGKRDGNFGSCMLTDHGYHCFAAGCTVNVLQMVQEQSEINGKKMSQYEALMFICKVNNFTLDTEETDPNPFPFSQEELSYLGYKKPIITREPVIYHFKPEFYHDKMYQTIQKDKKISITPVSLYEIWRESPTECLDILDEICTKMIEKTSKIIEEIKTNPLILSEKIENQEQDFVALYENIKLYYERLNELKTKIYFQKRKQKG